MYQRASPVYLAANIVSRIEIHRKQGSPLGALHVELPPLKEMPDSLVDNCGHAVINHDDGTLPVYG